MIYVWEIILIIPSIKDDTKKMRSSMLITASSIAEVWNYLSADRSDSNTEIESIVRIGPIVATLASPTKE